MKCRQIVLHSDPRALMQSDTKPSFHRVWACILSITALLRVFDTAIVTCILHLPTGVLLRPGLSGKSKCVEKYDEAVNLGMYLHTIKWGGRTVLKITHNFRCDQMCLNLWFKCHLYKRKIRNNEMIKKKVGMGQELDRDAKRKGRVRVTLDPDDAGIEPALPQPPQSGLGVKDYTPSPPWPVKCYSVKGSISAQLQEKNGF